jgi:hypothetical protein
MYKISGLKEKYIIQLSYDTTIHSANHCKWPRLFEISRVQQVFYLEMPFSAQEVQLLFALAECIITRRE